MAQSSACRSPGRFGILHALLNHLRLRPASNGPLARRRRVQPGLERLEDRTVLSITFTGVPNWIAEGPAPNSGGNAQGTNIPSESGVPNSPEDTGAIQAIAVNPGNAKQVFVGAVNGGVWRTNDITANPVAWVPLTDQFPSLEITSLRFDPTDGTNNTLVAGIGNSSNEFANLGPVTGLLKTTNDGNTWTQLGNSPLALGGLQGKTFRPYFPPREYDPGRSECLKPWR